MTTNNTSATQFISALADYTGDNFYNDIAYDFGVNEAATDASFGGANSTEIVFDDDSTAKYNESSKQWKAGDFNDSVFVFEIVDGVTRSGTMYVAADHNRPDESRLRELCEEYVGNYDRNAATGFTVCRIDFNFAENEYEVKNFKFAFDRTDFEWDTTREYVTY